MKIVEQEDLIKDCEVWKDNIFLRDKVVAHEHTIQCLKAELMDSTLIIAEKGKYEELLQRVEKCHNALRKAAEAFRGYVKIHKKKLAYAPETKNVPINDQFGEIREKIKRNVDLAEMCEEALKK
jgi:hypothetical protein